MSGYGRNERIDHTVAEKRPKILDSQNLGIVLDLIF